jgi:hypothetical protein
MAPVLTVWFFGTLCILQRASADAGSIFDRVRNAAVLSAPPENSCRSAGVTFNSSVGSPKYLLSATPSGLVPLLLSNGNLMRRAVSVNNKANGADWDYVVFHADFGCVDLGNSTGMPITISTASSIAPTVPLQFNFSTTLHPKNLDRAHRNQYLQDNLAQCMTYPWTIQEPPYVASHPSQNLDGFVSYTPVGDMPALSLEWLSKLMQISFKGGNASSFAGGAVPVIPGPLFTHGVIRYGNLTSPSTYAYQVPTALTCALANADGQAEAAFRSAVARVDNSWYKLVTAVWPNVLTMALAAWLAIDQFKSALKDRESRWESWNHIARMQRSVNLLGNLRRLFLQMVLLISAGLTILVVQCISERAGLLADWGAAYGLTVTYDVSVGARWGVFSQDQNNPFAGAAYIVSPWVVVFKLESPCGALGKFVVYGAVGFSAVMWLGAALYLNWRQQSDLYRSISSSCKDPPAKTRSYSPVLWVLRYRQCKWVKQRPPCAISIENFDETLVVNVLENGVPSVLDRTTRMDLLLAPKGVFNRFKTREELDVADNELRKRMSRVLNGTHSPSDDLLLRVYCLTAQQGSMTI